MKKLCTLIFLLACMTGKSQSFEGIVRWSMTMEITDPAMKAQMEQAQQQMADPETQKQLKEMQAKMNDPEMKKMLDANPQAKAAMESAMKNMGGGGAAGGMGGMMPTGMVLKVKGTSTVSIMEGGMGDGMEILNQKDQPATRIDRANKTYTRMPQGQQGGPAPQVKVTKTSETMKLLGYTCTKFISEVTERGKPIQQIFWTTTDIKDMDMKHLSSQRMGQGGSAMFYDQIEGVPLKIEMASPQGNMIMEVKEIKRQPMSADEFTVPAGFQEVKRPGGF